MNFFLPGNLHLSIQWLRALCLSTLLFCAPKVTAELKSVSDAEIQSVIAPVALYPDAVLSHLLSAASYPEDIAHARRWIKENDQLSLDDQLSVAGLEGWHPSVVALIAFPQVLQKMDEQKQWTQTVGYIHSHYPRNLLQHIQALRHSAYRAGTLDRLEHNQVRYEQNQISISPLNLHIFYLPEYDTVKVFGVWPWLQFPPVNWTRTSQSQTIFYGEKIIVRREYLGAEPMWGLRRKATRDYFIPDWGQDTFPHAGSIGIHIPDHSLEFELKTPSVNHVPNYIRRERDASSKKKTYSTQSTKKTKSTFKSRTN